MSELLRLEIHPVTPDRWPDFEALFGERGACAGCWCMWWKMKRSDFDRRHGQGTKKAQKKIIRSGQAPGLLAYAGGQPIGWCAIEPREAYPALERSRVLKRVDEQPVWSITCFFVARPYRREGVTIQLLKAAIKHAKAHGAQIVEGYPVEPRQDKVPDTAVFTGLASAFHEAGFTEALRRSEMRPIMRYVIGRRRSGR
jgi:GNAT superfamily N-acetyltransferase